MKTRILLAFALGSLSGAACVDEQLNQLSPDISLCATADAPSDACDGVLDVGDVVVTRQQNVDVFVVNRGDGRLNVDEAKVALETVTVFGAPDNVGAGNSGPITLTFALPEEGLGEGTTTITVKSDDDDEPEAAATLRWNGVLPPRPRIVLCDGDGEDASCSPTLDVDLGVVRPTQAASRGIFIRNVGDDALTVEDITLEGSAEIVLDSSTQGGTLEPGASAPVIVVYGPQAPGEDEATLTVTSDDPLTPSATATVHGSAADNLPPVADALDSVTGTSTAAVRVDDLVGVLGGGSSDPEGDPLTYAWSLEAPTGSSAGILDPAAENAIFTPDVAGVYRASLVVTDSLGQASAAATVEVTAAARFGFRARLSWSTAADLDLHLVEAGSAPFSARDCSFENRTVGAGDALSALDDAVLIDDAVTGPGSESAVIEAPVAGSWQVWVHVFADAGVPSTDATIDIVKDDDGTPILTLTRALEATCDLWHAADVTLPGVTAVDASATTVQQCAEGP